MRIEKKEENTQPKGEVVEILEDVRVPGTDIILEKGDKIEVFSSEKEEKETEDQGE